MGSSFQHIRRTYAIRDATAIPGQGGTHPLYVNGAGGMVQNVLPSENGRGGYQPLQSNGHRILQDVTPNPRAKRFAINFDQVAEKFSVPICKAAKVFKLSTSTLKLRCRELGFNKWPYPKLKCLKNLVNDLTEYQVRDFQSIVTEILEEIDSIKENPSLDIKDETKILRQQMYELKKKKRCRINAIAS